MAPVRETRREYQRFMERLEGRSPEERQRPTRDHAVYLAGERETDVGFDDDATPAPASASTRPAVRPPLMSPTGKDASYLRVQRCLISQQHRAVAAKTLAGSGKKRLAYAKRDEVEDDEDYDPEEDEEDVDAEEGLEYDSGEAPSKQKAKPSPKAPAKKNAAAKVPAKKSPAAKLPAKKKPAAKAPAKKKPATKKKPRKPSAAQVAKEKEREETKAAAVLRCEVSADAEERGTTALEDARKKLEDIAASKARKRQKTNVPKTPEASPMRYDMLLAVR